MESTQRRKRQGPSQLCLARGKKKCTGCKRNHVDQHRPERLRQSDGLTFDAYGCHNDVCERTIGHRSHVIEAAYVFGGSAYSMVVTSRAAAGILSHYPSHTQSHVRLLSTAGEIPTIVVPRKWCQHFLIELRPDRSAGRYGSHTCQPYPGLIMEFYLGGVMCCFAFLRAPLSRLHFLTRRFLFFWL
jgi:hypothetical protein